MIGLARGGGRGRDLGHARDEGVGVRERLNHSAVVGGGVLGDEAELGLVGVGGVGQGEVCLES